MIHLIDTSAPLFFSKFLKCISAKFFSKRVFPINNPSPNPVLGWVGSLSDFAPTSGYWVKVSDASTLIVEDALPLDASLTYDLHSGANLVSFPYGGSVGIADGLPDDIEGLVTGIIGEGVAASQIAPGNWVGSLSNISATSGYWVKMGAAGVLEGAGQPTDKN